ncbi:lipopolysaccharide transport periplasmic protein LptA [Simiduia sp. 21SJ11W-1]|uniref:lipopolysaccharide transport periplasmic protein LptA n=1 Tax=Simiduia sp. 21SJ11W-1 TaxID=2909669 RepID=UPI0020A099AE|nr:lipopolysaccharide transport periplasmic protein LptA [Simiduia sp. 21SJ11W-1]UTA48820.1 lipopolysaccharide transport periplasmic protein LptA [Simiduia sp. 21SJ11W-1]
MKHNNPRRSHAWLALAALAVMVTPLAQALPTDRDQPINIKSDDFDLDKKKGVLTYVGNVVIEQGSIYIEAEKAVFYSKNNEVYRVVATGAPAHFQQQPEIDKPLVKARGELLVYEVGNEKLTITGKARVEQDGSLITGDQINYNIHLATVEAGRRTDSKERVNVILQPQKRTPAEQKDQ